MSDQKGKYTVVCTTGLRLYLVPAPKSISKNNASLALLIARIKSELTPSDLELTAASLVEKLGRHYDNAIQRLIIDENVTKSSVLEAVRAIITNYCKNTRRKTSGPSHGDDSEFGIRSI